MGRARSLLFLLLVPAMAAEAVVFGNLELRWEHTSYQGCGSYGEQWLDLGYRDRDGWSGGVQGLMREGECNSAEVYSLFVDRRFAEGPLSGVRLGRFQRIDAAGYYYLDGLVLSGRMRHGIGWELFGGKPRREEFYAAPEHIQDADDRLAGKRLLGVRGSTRLPVWESTEQDRVEAGLGMRHLWGNGGHHDRLDGRFHGSWRQLPAGIRRADLDGAASLRLEQGEIESFDTRARLYFGPRGFVGVRGMTFDPPDDPVTFRDRFYLFYARGSQRNWELMAQNETPGGVQVGFSVKRIEREQGDDGYAGELYSRIRRWRGGQLKGRLGGIYVGDERSQLTYLEGERVLSSLSLLKLAASRIEDKNLLSGDKLVHTLELKLDWMLKRDLFLGVTAEHAWIDHKDINGLDDDYRVGIHLKYRLPASGQEDYR